MQTFLVGGAVRDALLGLTVKDKDWVVVGSSPAQMQAQGFIPVGKDFPVFLHPKTKEEYALARTERKHGQGYQGFIFDTAPSVTLEEDLYRRDLTINALAQDETGQLIDFYGGQKDLDQRLLRAVSPAFSEDPLRVLRTARFAARFYKLGFQVETNTVQLMRQLSASGELSTLSQERVWQEIFKALTTSNPEVFFQVLITVKALEQISPSLNNYLQLCPSTLDLLAPAAALSWPPEQIFALLLSQATPDILQNLNQELLIPKRFQRLSQAVARINAHAVFTKPDASNLMQLFDLTDAWRQPEIFNAAVAVACFAQQSPHQTKILHALEIALQVKAQDLVAQGFKGLALGQQLAAEREAHLAKHLIN